MPIEGSSGSAVPATPRWLLAIPDAIRQLDALDRELLTRRDLEQLFGVSRARAATLMQTFGAALTGTQRTLPRTQLLRQLRKHRAAGRLPRRGGRARAWWPNSARRGSPGSGSRCPAEALEARLSGLPAGVSVEPGRIEVRFSGAQEAVARLFALAQALTQRLRAVRGARRQGRGGRRRGSGEAQHERTTWCGPEPTRPGAGRSCCRG